MAYDGGVKLLTRGRIDARIEDLVARYGTVPDADGAQAIVSLVAAQAVASSKGGKRLRALLELGAFAAAAPADADPAPAADVACAIEIFQTAALVHDDIIDDSDLRRGAPAAHRALSDALMSRSRGDGLGLMLGDILATASIHVLHDAARSLPYGDAIDSVFLAMQREVEVGQIMDVAIETLPLDDDRTLLDTVLRTDRSKTASYTTIAPLELGLLCAGANPQAAHEAAVRIGETLGVAFQINDDLIDVTGTTATTGKPVGGDIREGKRTVLLADTLSHLSGAERDSLIEAYGSPDESARDTQAIIGLFRSSGAIDDSRRRIAQLWTATQAALDEQSRKLDLDADHACILRDRCAAMLPGFAL